ncbi:MAG: TRAP transporter TatT component family protein [Candidatus Marinimicrobia bacterium]|jgi:hypothetical protein|nr:TRAP transporter TatT component family protein [Candidatus Neomarinimicrobiota bacterium]MDP6789537.1 TRAP transporter TatT component family protein [Candidatus Neomarinimicrobiota bacterium]MDP7072443.1 TRAP transporter TatT component family protein [Candidatus Neomarinimicrobiota bacterium]
MNKIILSSVCREVPAFSLAKCTSFLLIIVIFLSGCSSLRTNTIPSKISDNAELLAERGENHWGKRIRPKDARLAHIMLKRAVSLTPHDQQLVALFARVCHFLAYYVEKDSETKEILYLEGADAAWECIVALPEYEQIFNSAQGDSAAKSLASLSVLTGNSIPLMYWYCANKGRYLAHKKVVERLHYRETLETMMHKIMSENSDYYFGGPSRFFGAFYARLPGVDLSIAADYFNKSIENSPDYFGTYILRARYLHTKAGDRTAFEKDLQFVLDADPTVLPDVMPENLMAQERAEELLTHINMLFE